MRDGQQVGQLLFIECQPIGAGQFERLDGAGSNTETTGTITMTPGDMIQFIWNGSDWADRYLILIIIKKDL